MYRMLVIFKNKIKNCFVNFSRVRHDDSIGDNERANDSYFLNYQPLSI